MRHELTIPYHAAIKESAEARRVAVAIEEESMVMRVLEKANALGLEGKRLTGFEVSDEPDGSARHFWLLTDEEEPHV